MLSIQALSMLLILTMLTACATPVALQYDHPQSKLDQSSQYVLVIEPVEDVRSSGRDIDEALMEHPCIALTAILEEEMESTGLFADVVRSTDAEQAAALLDDPHRKHLKMKASLVDLAWDVPGYQSIQVTRSVSAQFGALGLLANAAFESEDDVSVFGRTTIAVKLWDADTDQVLLAKDYYGVIQERSKVIDCDKNETKSHIVAESTNRAMDQIKTEVSAILAVPVRGRSL
jgi:hypothetical protein